MKWIKNISIFIHWIQRHRINGYNCRLVSFGNSGILLYGITKTPFFMHFCRKNFSVTKVGVAGGTYIHSSFINVEFQMFVDDNNVQCHEIPYKIDLNRSKLIRSWSVFPSQMKWNNIHATNVYKHNHSKMCPTSKKKGTKKIFKWKTYFTCGYYHILHVKMCDMKCVMCNELA